MSKKTYIDIDPKKVTASEVRARKAGVAIETSITISSFAKDVIYLEHEDELFQFLNNPPDDLSLEHRFYIQMLNLLIQRKPIKSKSAGRPEKRLSESTFVWSICVLLGSKNKAALALGIETKAIRVHVSKLDSLGITPFSDREFSHNNAIGTKSLAVQFHAMQVAKNYEEALQDRAQANKSDTLTQIRERYTKTREQTLLIEYQSLFKRLNRIR
ncbi:hypothetical protein [Vibrio tasmaniensis]|uniref:hypothetical protein n=1 Tax=Vibrio tasmaniensis TaxID=212663 RepID=UPI0010805194|nr:hypothetical protein [Vibrio tasmaniensis]